MKQVYKCDYCVTLDVEEKIREHEVLCDYNPDNKSCLTCLKAQIQNGSLQYCSINKILKRKNSFYGINIIPNKYCNDWEHGTPKDISIIGI